MSPPSVVPEQLNNNNTIVRQNEQSLVVKVCDLKAKDARAVFKNISIEVIPAEEFKLNIPKGTDIVGFESKIK